MINPREVVDKHDYYMGLAFMAASRSKDPNTQVGAYIVSKNNEPISSGYNGLPRKIKDDSIDWDRPNKYSFVHHAEDNALWHARKDNLEDATIYVTMHPCGNCMLDIARSGIYKVIYFNNKFSAKMLNETEVAKSKEIALASGLDLVEFSGKLNWIRDFVEEMKNKNIFN